MADDLLCNERFLSELPRAQRDPVIFSDLRVLKNLIHLERQFVPMCDYFSTIQTDIKPFMRQVVGTWMLEVCDDLGCENQIFPLAVNLLDRFLSVCCIRKRFLQLAASVSLMLASKVRQCQEISMSRLCYYADHSFNSSHMKDWELLFLSKLQWNLTAVTAHDFVDHIIERVGVESEHRLMRQHAVTLICVCYTLPDFLVVKPSIIAAACIASAARGLRTASSSTILDSICQLLDDTTPMMVEPVIDRIEEAMLAEAKQSSAPDAYGMDAVTPDKRSTYERQPDTPPDVSDINF